MASLTAIFSAEAAIKPADGEGILKELRTSNSDLVIQLVTVKELPRAQTVRMIAAQTVRAMETGALLASKPEMDLLLRLAGTRQISVAMERCGYKMAGKKVLVALGPESPLERLRERLVHDKAFREISGESTDEEGLRLVENAALLGARS